MEIGINIAVNTGEKSAFFSAAVVPGANELTDTEGSPNLLVDTQGTPNELTDTF